MRNLEKYEGVIPAFYACYDENGNISEQGVQDLTKYFIDKGVKGVYVNGSSGECIYQTGFLDVPVLDRLYSLCDRRTSGATCMQKFFFCATFLL